MGTGNNLGSGANPDASVRPTESLRAGVSSSLCPTPTAAPTSRLTTAGATRATATRDGITVMVAVVRGITLQNLPRYSQIVEFRSATTNTRGPGRCSSRAPVYCGYALL